MPNSRSDSLDIPAHALPHVQRAEDMNMKHPKTVTTAETDLATWLARLASHLRNDRLSLLARVHLESSPGTREARDLAQLWDSLDCKAALMDAIKERLCTACRLMEITERVTLGTELDGDHGSSRKGGQGHEQEQGGRKVGRRR